MNPNGEPVNPNSPDGAVPAAPAAPASADLGSLEKAVNDAQKEEAATSPIDQFKAQFGDPVGSVPSPVTESPVSATDPILSDIKQPLSKPSVEAPKDTSGDSYTPTAEAALKAEKTPAEKLKKEISDSVNAFLEEVTKEKSVV